MNESQKKEFDRLSKILIQWLRVNGHPHMKIIIDNESAELVEGIQSFILDDQ
jgi:hypothetical protein